MPDNYANRAIAAMTAIFPDKDPHLLRLYTLLALTKGAEATLSDVHDAWAMNRTLARPDHPDLVPFEQLAPESRERDRKYMEAIHKVAGGLR